MRARILVLATAVVVLVLTVPIPALAGGWWTYIDIEHEPVGVGETVTAETAVMFPDMAAADRARDAGGYQVHLLREVDQAMLGEAMSKPYVEGWWDPPEDPIWLAEVELSGWDANLAHATATFEVPPLPAGEYALMFCTAGCAEPLADVVPLLGVRVFPDAATARLARDVDTASGMIVELRQHLADRVDGVRADVRDTRQVIRTIGADIAGIEKAVVAGLGAASDPPPPAEATPWWGMAGWFVAGFASAAALVLWRQRRRDPLEDHDLPSVPDDAGELVTGPPVPLSSTRR